MTQVHHTMLGKLLQERYQVVRLLGTGGFCQTYLAKDLCQPGHPTCVVKHLLPANNQPESLFTLKHLFIREVGALKKLEQCDRVPRLLDYFEENFEFYLVQEFIEGRPLSAELPRGFRWSESYVVQLLQEVLSILEVVHAQGLIHCDVKPTNLIRRQQDNRLVLIDFGSVKQAWTHLITDPDTTSTTATAIPATIAVGTPGYMPAEQMRGFPRLNSDIYALGTIAIQALTGLHPRQLLEDSDTGDPIWQSQANVSSELASILNRMVCYHFKDRYHSATEVLQALRPLTVLYKPIKQVAYCQGQASSQRLVTPFSEPDTVLFAWQDNSEAIANVSTSDAKDSTPAHQSVLLIGIGIGVSSVLALAASIYYVLQPPAPAANIPQYQVVRPASSF